MAKFKKKKSEPTESPEISDTGSETPEVAKAPEAPKKPELSPPADPSTYRKKLDQLYWLRIILAAIAGAVATFAFENIEGEERRWASIGFMIIVYGVTIIIAKGMRMQLPSSDRKKLVTQAIGSYVFIYLFVWIVSYTLVNIQSGGSGLVLLP